MWLYDCVITGFKVWICAFSHLNYWNQCVFYYEPWTRHSCTTGLGPKLHASVQRVQFWASHLKKLELVQEKIQIKVFISLNLIARLIKIKYWFKVFQLAVKPGLIRRTLILPMIVCWAPCQKYKHLQYNNNICDGDLHYQGVFFKFILRFWFVHFQPIRFVWRNLSFVDTYSTLII